MTSFGSVVGQAAQATNLALGAKPLASLVEKFKVALQQKEPRELGRILAEVKALGTKAEKAFLAAAVKTEGNTLSAAATLKASVVAGFSVEQRAELAKELFSLKGIKGPFFGKASLESKLAKYLGQMGQEKSVLKAAKDEMVRGGVWEAGASMFQQAAQGVAQQPAEKVVAGEAAASPLPLGGGWGHSPDNWTAADMERFRQRPRPEPKTPEEG